jgi:hypothetical protein
VAVPSSLPHPAASEEKELSTVIIGMDPHKRSATIEILDRTEHVLGHGRYPTDTTGYRDMLAHGRRYTDRTWAVEGCNGIGKHIAQRLVADGETVIDVPAKLSARTRVSPPARAARPTLPTLTRSPWSPSAPPT